MIARVRKSMDEKDEGFTLIELLVVIIIIGILASIAIPVFLNQRKKAVDAGIKSDIRTVATAMETDFTDAQVYPSVSTNAATATTLTVGSADTAITLGNVITVKLSTNKDKFCIFAINAKGTSATDGFTWISDKGGLQAGKAAASGCTTANGF